MNSAPHAQGEKTMASTPAFTPGPWTYWRDVGFGVGGDGFAVARTIGGMNIEQEKANAALIASAPDLYEALKDLLADDSPVWPWVNQVGIGKAEYKFRSAIVERARAALARVEG